MTGLGFVQGLDGGLAGVSDSIARMASGLGPMGFSPALSTGYSPLSVGGSRGGGVVNHYVTYYVTAHNELHGDEVRQFVETISTVENLPWALGLTMDSPVGRR